MPIHVHANVRHLDQREFGRIAYDVMEQVFVVHNEMGRFFDEAIYRDAVAARVERAQTEVPIVVHFEDFRKDYFIDLLVDGGAVFELKSVRSLGANHKAQLLNYLLLTGLSHGKLVNFRHELVEHEFLNTHLNRAELTSFRVDENNWRDPGPADRSLKPWLIAFLRDVGAGLHVSLYENAVAHVFGGEDAVFHEVEIFGGARRLGRQKVRLASADWAFKITAVRSSDMPRFEDHMRRFLAHTQLGGVHWINIIRESVTFCSIEKE